MNFYNLSHLLNNESPVYPGKEKPEFTPVAVIRENGYCETHLNFDSHLGTHIDAPAHMLEKGKTLDKMSVDSFTGKAFIVSVPDQMPVIDIDFLLNFKDKFTDTDFVLFKTGWSKYWGFASYFKKFPTLTSEAVNMLVSHPLKGIGFDTISADPVDSTAWENHYAIFEKGLIIIENLIFPEDLTADKGRFFCFPISFENADGSPVRAVLETS